MAMGYPGSGKTGGKKVGKREAWEAQWQECGLENQDNQALLWILL